MKSGVILILLVTLCGCVRYQPHPMVATDNAGRLEARRLDDAGLKEFLEKNGGHTSGAWPKETWDLNSLSLAAFYFHPSLEVARAQWRVAQAGIKTAGGRPNPTLGLTPGYDTTSNPGLSPWIPFFSVDIPLETAGKRGKRMAEASQLTEAARWNTVSVAWQIRSAVRSALLDYTVADHRAALLERQLAAEEKTVQKLRERLAAGDISQPEVTTVEINLSRARLDLADARSTKSQARAQLAQAVGIGGAAFQDQHFAFALEAGMSNDLTSASLRKLALVNRADVRAALATYAAAESDLRLQIAKQYPDIHFAPGYQFDQGDNKWCLGLTFEVPILNQNQGPIAEADARRMEAAARFTELQAKVIGQVDLALAAYASRRESFETFQNLMQAERSRSESAIKLFQAGAGEELDVLGAEVESSNAELLELDAEAKLQQAIGSLEDAVQRPADQNFEVVTGLEAASSKKEHP